MPRAITNEQREQLFNEVDELEFPIGELEALCIVLNRIAQCAEGKSDGDAIYLVAGELCRRASQLSDFHDTLFHGLHESPTSREEAIAKLAARHRGQS